LWADVHEQCEPQRSTIYKADAIVKLSLCGWCLWRPFLSPVSFGRAKEMGIKTNTYKKPPAKPSLQTMLNLGF